MHYPVRGAHAGDLTSLLTIGLFLSLTGNKSGNRLFRAGNRSTRMTSTLPQKRFWPGVLIAAISGAVLSALALMVLAMGQTGSPWTAINATSHILHGPAAGGETVFDLTHTVVGLVIHFGSCLFWAVVAMGLLRAQTRRDMPRILLTGLGTSLIALLLDYAILPRALSPGWHLALAPTGVLIGFLALGFGLSLGMMLGLMTAPRRSGESIPRNTGHPARQPTSIRQPVSDEVAALRHPPGTIDQRQQRIDPANHVTRDPNSQAAHSTKQPGRNTFPTESEGNDA